MGTKLCEIIGLILAMTGMSAAESESILVPLALMVIGGLLMGLAERRGDNDKSETNGRL